MSLGAETQGQFSLRISVKFEKFRRGKTDAFYKRVKRSGFENKTRDVIARRDPNARVFIPYKIH
jgi:hypothetical protein